jgi:hypothetical protein
VLDMLNKEDWEVRPVSPAIGRSLVEAYHYAGGASNTATYLHGLFRKEFSLDDRCFGVAWWIPPTKSAALATYPADWRGVLCLSRLVLDPRVPQNGASFLLARSRKLIDRERWPALVTYADEWRGHTGQIYRADNWDYIGKTKPERTYVIGERMVTRKAGPKTRTHAEMLALGAEMVGSHAKHKFVRLDSR